jgi:hypothetical protein
LNYEKIKKNNAAKTIQNAWKKNTIIGSAQSLLRNSFETKKNSINVSASHSSIINKNAQLKQNNKINIADKLTDEKNENLKKIRTKRENLINLMITTNSMLNNNLHINQENGFLSVIFYFNIIIIIIIFLNI